MTTGRSSIRIAAGPWGPAVFACVLVALASGCGGGESPETPAAFDAALHRERVHPREIQLDLGFDPSLAEFSGLVWWGDRLVLLPQYPEHLSDDEPGVLLTIDRARLAAYIGGLDTTAIRPDRVLFDDGGLHERLSGWDGYEAIVLHEDRVLLSIERIASEHWESALVQGHIVGDPPAFVIDGSHHLDIPSASGRPNFSEEALVVAGSTVWSLHELNGRNVNASPRAVTVDFDLRTARSLTMPTIEYRITDATTVDEQGRFWVFNQFWPGEAEMVDPAIDSLAARSRPEKQPVERIVALRCREKSIELDRERGVIELIVRDDWVARNWEGLVRWNDDGFLIVTDRHPRTMFAYVPRRAAP